MVTVDDFFAAVEKGDVADVRTALSQEEPVHVDQVNDHDGGTALALAAAKGHTEVVELLLHNGANVNAVNRCGNTALHLAAASSVAKAPKVVKLLLDAGADVKIQNIAGRRALTLALRSYTRCKWLQRMLFRRNIYCLLEAGARLQDDQGDKGECPVLIEDTWATMKGMDLMANVADESSACSVSVFLAVGLVVNDAVKCDTIKKASAALPIAVTSLNSKVVKALLKAGAAVTRELLFDLVTRHQLHELQLLLRCAAQNQGSLRDIKNEDFQAVLGLLAQDVMNGRCGQMGFAFIVIKQCLHCAEASQCTIEPFVMPKALGVGKSSYSEDIKNQLRTCVKTGDISVVYYMSHCIAELLTPNDLQGCVRDAVMDGHLDVIKVLHSVGKLPITEFSDERGTTLLMLSAAHRKCEVTEFLYTVLDSWAASDAKQYRRATNKIGYTALSHARQSGDEEIVRRLVQDISDRPCYQLATVRMLLDPEQWVRKSSSDCKPATVLAFVAEHWGDDVIIGDLVAAGADVNAAMIEALVNAQHDAVRTLKRNGADLNTALINAVEQNNTDAMNALLVAGADMNIALTMAAWNGHRGVVCTLISLGADVNQQDEQGFTAFNFAAIGRHAEVLKVLAPWQPSRERLLRGASFFSCEPCASSQPGSMFDEITNNML